MNPIEPYIGCYSKSILGYLPQYIRIIWCVIYEMFSLIWAYLDTGALGVEYIVIIEQFLGINILCWDWIRLFLCF